MLLSMYLSSHVFQQKEQSKETAMAFACDFSYLTATCNSATPGALFPRISFFKQRNKYRKLLLSTTTTAPATTAREHKLFSNLWCRKRRRKFIILNHNCSAQKLLLKLKLLQYNRSLYKFLGAAHTKIISSSHESIEEG